MLRLLGNLNFYHPEHNATTTITTTTTTTTTTLTISSANVTANDQSSDKLNKRNILYDQWRSDNVRTYVCLLLLLLLLLLFQVDTLELLTQQVEEYW